MEKELQPKIERRETEPSGMGEDEKKEWQELEHKSSKTTEEGLTEEEHIRLLQLRGMKNWHLLSDEALEKAKLEIKSRKTTEEGLTMDEYSRLMDLRQKVKPYQKESFR